MIDGNVANYFVYMEPDITPYHKVKIMDEETVYNIYQNGTDNLCLYAKCVEDQIVESYDTYRFTHEIDNDK